MNDLAILTEQVFRLTVDRSVPVSVLLSVLDKYPPSIGRIFEEQKGWRGDPYEIVVEVSSFAEEIIGDTAIFDAIGAIEAGRQGNRWPNTFEILVMNFFRRRYGLRGRFISKTVSLGAPSLLIHDREAFREEKVVSMTWDFEGYALGPETRYISVRRSGLDLGTYEDAVNRLTPDDFASSA